MRYGVYTSPKKEVVLTKRFVLMFYDTSTAIGIKLFYDNKLIAECERDMINNITSYAFGDKCEPLEFDYDTDGLDLIEEINITNDIVINPTVSEAGISECLRTWKLGNTLNMFDDSIFFTMNTKRVEYVIMIREINNDIYCGASINIPHENGLYGGNQYFRIRNYMDNTAPFCYFHSNLDANIITIDTNNSINWEIKTFTDDKIILQGCGDSEYIYNRDLYKTEIFI